ncbi:MAG: putative capsid protein [Cressdnaviricota sp.]|nr:MAG: putative capsid protein [Cressdnaviricota sp.]
MPRVTFNRLSKKRASTRKRRTSVITRAKYAKKTVSTNRSLIKANAYALRAVKQMLPPPVYCDFQYSGVLLASNTDAPLAESSYSTAELMTPKFWASVLRQDPNVEEASSTLVKRMQINFRHTLQTSNYAQVTCFIVSLRKDAANRNLLSLVAGQDYIYDQADNFNVRLNSAVFKCHYSRNITMTKNTLFYQPPVVGGVALATSPGLTFAKGQVNLKLNYRLRQPLGTTWREMECKQLIPQQRLYVLCFWTHQADAAGTPPPELGYDALYTTFNSS